MIQIINITNSPRKTKRLRVFLSDGSTFDFGLKGAQTYVDEEDQKKRTAYWSRHYSNEKEQFLIDNLEPSPALFSAYILWGFHTSIDDNIRYLNRLFSKLK